MQLTKDDRHVRTKEETQHNTIYNKTKTSFLRRGSQRPRLLGADRRGQRAAMMGRWEVMELAGLEGRELYRKS